jgi:hypothetical protein
MREAEWPHIGIRRWGGKKINALGNLSTSPKAIPAFLASFFFKAVER